MCAAKRREIAVHEISPKEPPRTLHVLLTRISWWKFPPHESVFETEEMPFPWDTINPKWFLANLISMVLHRIDKHRKWHILSIASTNLRLTYENYVLPSIKMTAQSFNCFANLSFNVTLCNILATFTRLR